MLLQIARIPEGLQVEGEIDMASAPQLVDALSRLDRSDGRLVIDLAGVTFMDSTGLHAVLNEVASRNGSGPLVLRNPTRSVRRLLDIGFPAGVEGLEVQE
jgi:anti-sigma B factor antagonist